MIHKKKIWNQEVFLSLKMEVNESYEDLRQALLTPSTLEDVTHSNGESSVFLEAPPFLSLSPPRSFNETSFSFRNFLFGRQKAESTTSRVVLWRQLNHHSAEVDGDDTNDPQPRVPGWLLRFHTTIQMYRVWLLVGIVLLVWPLGGWSGGPWPPTPTDSTLRSVPGTLSAMAEAAMAAAYPMDLMRHPALVVVLTATTTTANNNNNATRLPSNLTRFGTAAYEQGRTFARQLGPYLQSRCWTWSDDATATLPRNDSSSSSCTNHSDWLRVTSYYSLVDDDLRGIARGGMAVPDGSSVWLTIAYTTIFTTAATTHESPRQQQQRQRRVAVELMAAVDQYQTELERQRQAANATQYFTVHGTGRWYLAADAVRSARRDVRVVVLWVGPWACLMGVLLLPSARIAVVGIIGVFTVLTTVSVGSTILRYAVTPFWPISTLAVTIMTSLSLGLGLDYTLFLLARYLEEVGKGRSRKRAILRMLWGSGRVLVGSGVTMAVTLGGWILLPLGLWKGIGVGAAIAVLSALVVNLVTVTALLSTPLGGWIIAVGPTAKIRHRNPPMGSGEPLFLHSVSQMDHTASNGNIVDGGDDVDDVLLGEPLRRLSLESAVPTLPRHSIWFRLSKHLLHPYRGIIILLATLQLLFLVAHQAGRIKPSISLDLLLPAQSPALQTFHSLSEQVGPGKLNPYRILFDGHQANITMTSKAGFDVMHLVLDQLLAMDQTDRDAGDAKKHIGATAHDHMIAWSQRILDPVDLFDSLESTGQKSTVYNGISVWSNMRVPHGIYVSAKLCSRIQPHCPVELLHVIDATDKLVTSGDNHATWITATLAASPFSDEGVEWLNQARATMDRLESVGALSGVKVYIDGSAGIAYDTVTAVYSYFCPSMIVITTTVVFILMGIFFKSVFLPIRSIVSISLTLAFSFGLSVLVFQDGVLNWTSIQALTSIGDELCWLVPIMAFTIVVGLTLHYDVFLTSRILEYRLEGYEHRSSIALGLDATGGIITAAGVITAVAFGSLMFSSNPVLYQWSFLVTSAVLLDTFVVRTIVVPILTGMAGKYCWWPRRLPDEQICYEEFQSRQDDVAGLLRTLEASSEYEPLSPLR